MMTFKQFKHQWLNEGSRGFGLRSAVQYQGKTLVGRQGQHHSEILRKEIGKAAFDNFVIFGHSFIPLKLGFIDHTGNFLDRESAMTYARSHGLISPERQAKFSNDLFWSGRGELASDVLKQRRS